MLQKWMASPTTQGETTVSDPVHGYYAACCHGYYRRRGCGMVFHPGARSQMRVGGHVMMDDYMDDGVGRYHTVYRRPFGANLGV